MEYRDSELTVKFSVGKSSLDCIFRNISESPIELIWNSSSMVIYGNATSFSSGQTLLIDATRSKPNAVIPANSTFSESIFPNCNIKRSSNIDVLDLYLTESQSADSFPKPGEKIKLLLAAEINSRKIYKNIDLELIEAKVTERKEYVPGSSPRDINNTLLYGCLGTILVLGFLFY
ncbi:MAG: hypothetical protein JNL57_06960 [Bacteroidetes bacterium]|nr:hypothetical protein [Bacteroidota bacterium]